MARFAPQLRLIAILPFALWVCACSESVEPIVYGSERPVAELVSEARTLTDLASEDAGAEVVVSGTISRVCQTMGCWFYLAQGDSLVYVDLEQGSRFTIPVDSSGKRAVVAATYHADGGDARLVAKSAVVWP
jgi:hypothetical protein